MNKNAMYVLKNGNDFNEMILYTIFLVCGDFFVILKFQSIHADVCLHFFFNFYRLLK